MGIVIIPRACFVGRSNVYNLLTLPYLKHPGYLMEGGVNIFPINLVKLASKENICFMKPRPGELFMDPELKSIPFIGGKFIPS